MNAKLSTMKTDAVEVLPREGAFVLQLGLKSQVGGGQLRGRVEHVASGVARSFQSMEEVQSFVVAVLAQSPEFGAE